MATATATTTAAAVVVPVAAVQASRAADPNALSPLTQRFRLYVNYIATNITSAVKCIYKYLRPTGISKAMVKTISFGHDNVGDHGNGGGTQPSSLVAVVTLLNTAPARIAQDALRYFDHAAANQNTTATNRTAACSITPASSCADGSAHGPGDGQSCLPCPVGSTTNRNNQCEACTNVQPCWAIEGWPGACHELHMAELASDHCDAPVSIVGQKAANWAAYGVPTSCIITIILTIVGLCYNHRENQKLQKQAVEDRRRNAQLQQNQAAAVNAFNAVGANYQLLNAGAAAAQPQPAAAPPPAYIQNMVYSVV